MEPLTVEAIQEARELIWPEEFLSLTAEEIEGKRICAEHGQRLNERLSWAVWEACVLRHGGKVGLESTLSHPLPQRMRPRGFG